MPLTCKTKNLVNLLLTDTARMWQYIYIYIYNIYILYIYIYIKQLMVASGQQRMPRASGGQRFTVQASLHGIKTR